MVEKLGMGLGTRPLKMIKFAIHTEKRIGLHLFALPPYPYVLVPLSFSVQWHLFSLLHDAAPLVSEKEEQITNYS